MKPPTTLRTAEITAEGTGGRASTKGPNIGIMLKGVSETLAQGHRPCLSQSLPMPGHQCNLLGVVSVFTELSWKKAKIIIPSPQRSAGRNSSLVCKVGSQGQASRAGRMVWRASSVLPDNRTEVGSLPAMTVVGGRGSGPRMFPPIPLTPELFPGRG